MDLFKKLSAVEEYNDLIRDYNDLLREVDRLQHDIADLQMLRDEHQMDNMHAFQEGGEEERRKVVAWLREQANSTTVDVLRARDLDAADLIERGEHRREEDE